VELAWIPPIAPRGENHIQHAVESRISSLLVELIQEVRYRRHRIALPSLPQSPSIFASFPEAGPTGNPGARFIPGSVALPFVMFPLPGLNQ
jgi:hypothetical protein